MIIKQQYFNYETIVDRRKSKSLRQGCRGHKDNNSKSISISNKK